MNKRVLFVLPPLLLISALGFALGHQPKVEAASNPTRAISAHKRVKLYPEIAAVSLACYAQTCSELVQARVERVDTVVQKSGIPHLEITLRLLRALKGESRATLVVTMAGGETNDVRVDVVGAPRLTVGDEIVAFLCYDPSGLIGFQGLAQGVYSVISLDGGGFGVRGLHANGMNVEEFFERVSGEWVK